MKKFVKFISLFCCSLLILTSFFFVPVGNTSSYLATTSASSRSVSNTYNYNAEVSFDNNSLGDYAISSIDSVNVNGSFVGHYHCSGVSSADIWFFRFYSPSSVSDVYIKYLVFNNDNFVNNSDFDISFLIIVNSGVVQMHPFGNTGSLYQNLLYIPNGTRFDFDIYFTTRQFAPVGNDWNFNGRTPSISDFYLTGSNNMVTLQPQEDLDFSSLIDMDSSTNFQVPYHFAYVNSSKVSSKLLHNLNFKNDFNISTSYYYSSAKIYYTSQQLSLININVSSSHTFCFAKVQESSILFDYFNFYFDINRPTYRTNNSLIIYNFDYYNYLYSLSRYQYSLRLDNDIYYIDYFNSLPNNKYYVFYNDEINNNIFDEYIRVFLSRSSSGEAVPTYSLDKYFNTSYSNIDWDTYTVYFPLGFDFNFTYYSEPLVSSNAVYNYTFTKPSYVDGSISFSMTPPKLIIPVLAWVENAFIFLVFYCPIISDIIELLHFDKFFGVIIEMFNIYTSSLFGDFIFGCFALIIFYGLLKLIMPSIASSAKGWDNSPVIDSVSAVHHFNRNRKKQKLLNKKLSSSRNNRVVAKKHSKKDKSYMRSSTFTTFKSKNNLDRYVYAKHRTKKNRKR